LDSLAEARRAARASGADIQIVVQDGMSTDGTQSLVRERMEKGDILFSGPDTGIYQAMNRAVRAATGRWILFLGADDRLLMTTICSRLGQVVDPMVVLIVGDSRRGHGVIRGRWGYRMLFAHSVNHQACIYRRSVFERLSFPEEYRLAGDYWLNLRLYLGRARILAWRGELVSDYGTEGASSTQSELAMREEMKVRRELMGSFGALANLVKAAKLRCAR
jgi:glycosyltransferase involved in cell wall biosynthesis